MALNYTSFVGKMWLSVVWLRAEEIVAVAVGVIMALQFVLLVIGAQYIYVFTANIVHHLSNDSSFKIRQQRTSRDVAAHSST